MPKLNARVVIAVLISLGVILAIAATVSAEVNHVGTSIFASANNHAAVSGRVSMSVRTGTYTQYQSVNQGSGHDCGSPSPSPDD